MNRSALRLAFVPPLTRFSVYITGRDYGVDTAPQTRKQLTWKTKAPCEEAMKRIGESVKEGCSKP